MSASMAALNCTFTCSPLSTHKTNKKPLTSTFSLTPKTLKPISKTLKLTPPQALTAESSSTDFISTIPEQEAERVGVVVKPGEKPRLVLKFIWMEKNIGLALDQVIPGHGTIPLSPYFFWPRKDAWEELKTCLESKPWISQKKMIILLNQATDIINLWQQSGGNITTT